MSLVQYNNFNQPNLNGLVDINSDNITTTSISTGEIIVNGENIVDDVLDNKRKLTKIDYDDLEDVTEIDSDLLLTGSILLDDVIITKEELKYLDDARSNIQAQIDAEADDISSLTTRVTTNENDILALEQKTTKISYNSISDTTTADGNFTVSDELNVTSELTLKDDPTFAGYTFLLNTNGKYLYFRVKDMAGNIRTFQIHHTQIYTTIPMYLDGNVTVNTGKLLFIGDNSNVLRYLANPDVNAGMRYENRINNYYTNFLQRNSSGGEQTVFRLHFDKIVSMIRHDFNDGVTIGEDFYTMKYISSFNPAAGMTYDNKINNYYTNFIQRDISGNEVGVLRLHNSKIDSLIRHDFAGETNFNGTINFNDDINFNSAITSPVVINNTLTLQNIIHTPGTNYIIENTTNTGSFTFRVRDVDGIVRNILISQFGNISGLNDVGCNKVLMGSTTLRQDGSVFSGAVTFNGTNTYTGSNTFNGSIVSNNSVTFNNGLSMITGSLSQQLAAGIVQFTFLSSGTNIFKASDYFGRINMTSTDPAQNRITQTILSGDTINQHNNMKYTIMRYISGTGTSTSAILALVENTSQNQFAFYPSLPGGAFNPIVDNQSRTLLANGTGSQNNNSLVFTCWATTRVGMKIKATPSVSTSEIWAGTTNITVNSNTGTSMNNVNSIGFTGGKTVDGNFGNIYTATLLTSISMTDNTETTLSDGLVLPAGTYTISWNITFIIDNSGTNVAFCYGCYSTSTSSFTNNTILTSEYKNYTIPVGNFFSLTGQDFVHFGTSTTIYLRGLVAHNKGANHVMFHNTFSNLKAIKIC